MRTKLKIKIKSYSFKNQVLSTASIFVTPYSYIFGESSNIIRQKNSFNITTSSEMSFKP